VLPLRERREDIALLVSHFLKRFSTEFRKPIDDISADAIKKLESYEWPGNVRELKNVIERAVLLGAGPVVGAEDLTLGRSTVAPPDKDKKLFSIPTKGFKFDDLEKDIVLQALERTNGNQTKAGELLGMTRDQIHYRMEKFGLLKQDRSG